MAVTIIYKRSTPGLILGKDIPAGTYFTGTVGSVKGLFLKSLLGYIFGLLTPVVWDRTFTDGREVINYQPVDVTITVEGINPNG